MRLVSRSRSVSRSSLVSRSVSRSGTVSRVVVSAKVAICLMGVGSLEVGAGLEVEVGHTPQGLSWTEADLLAKVSV